MDQENNVVKLYNKGIKNISSLIVCTIMLGLMFLILFVAEPASGSDDGARLFITCFFLLFFIVFFKNFYDSNVANKNALFIKENGNVYYGKVLHVKKVHKRSSKGHSRTYRYLLVGFNDGNVNRLILSRNFPYKIYTNEPDLFDIMKNTEVVDEYRQSRSENVIDHVQYVGKGYITFNPNEDKTRAVYFNESASKNYEGELTCKVFEYDGKYVVDDIEGYDMNIIRSNKMISAIIIIVWLVIVASAILTSM